MHLWLHGSASTPCPECGKRFSRLASRKAHVLQHVEDDVVTCRHCDSEFETSRALERHMDEEHGLGGAAALRTEAAHLTLTELNGSVANQLSGRAGAQPPDAIKSYVCKQCQQQFDTFRDLKEHSRFHKKVSVALRRLPYDDLRSLVSS